MVCVNACELAACELGVCAGICCECCMHSSPLDTYVSATTPLNPLAPRLTAGSISPHAHRCTPLLAWVAQGACTQ
jgi:hypothetical protein